MEKKLVEIKTRIVIPGGAGLVGQNLIARLVSKGYINIIVLDKHRSNIEVLKQLQPGVRVEYADLAASGEWCRHFDQADVVIMLQAQIGGNDYQEFVLNNISSTKNILNLIERYSIPKLIHISSSVVESNADDFYTATKKAQENLVVESGISCTILRPTLMFGWFDRKHLGWLSRFMKKVPLFPIPGNGEFMRQPLYVGDFCSVITSCIEGAVSNGVFNISGLEKVNYIDIVREIKLSTKAKSVIIKIPYLMFYTLIWFWNLFDKTPPFTTQQLEALVANDEFEVIDWPRIFRVRHTPFTEAIHETFSHPIYSKVVLEF